MPTERVLGRINSFQVLLSLKLPREMGLPQPWALRVIPTVPHGDTPAGIRYQLSEERQPSSLVTRNKRPTKSQGKNNETGVRAVNRDLQNRFCRNQTHIERKYTRCS